MKNILTIFLLSQLLCLSTFAIDSNFVVFHKFKFVFIYDSNECINCDVAALTSYIYKLEKLYPTYDIEIVSNSKRNSDIDFLRSKFDKYKIIKDTNEYYMDLYNVEKTLALIVLNENGIPIQKYEELQTNPININELNKLSQYKNLSALQIIGEFDYKVLPRGGKFQFDKEGKLIAVNTLNNCIVKIDIEKKEQIFKIEPDESIQLYYLQMYDPSMYKSLRKDSYPLARINFFLIDSLNNLIVDYTVVNSIQLDTIFKLRGNDTILETSKYYYSSGLEVQYNRNKVSKIFQPPVKLNLHQIELVHNKYFALAGYFDSFNFDDIIKNDIHQILIKSDTPDFNNYQSVLSYKQTFKEFKMDKFNTLTLGIFCYIDSNEYIYMNPWNNLFFIYKDGFFKRIKMTSFLSEIYNKNLKKNYSLNNLVVKDNNIYVMIQEFDKKKLCNKFIVQQYDVNGNFIKELIYHNNGEQLYYAYLVNRNGSLIVIYQDSAEYWRCFNLLSNF